MRSTRVIAASDSAETENPSIPSAPSIPAVPNPAGSAAQRTLSQLGDYLLLKKLGSGAMGAVYKARELSTRREVALKVLFKHIADNPKLVERFHREARVTAALTHPNIVRGFGVGQDHGWHFFAMEFVDGDSLQKWLVRLGKLSLGDTLHLILACARALQHAHTNDIVHRDIKPDNILITRTGETKVADLGMVKQLDEDMSLTQTGHAVGTPWYMPLEQAKNSKDTDGRCDIYALGCVFYACLTGQPPFTGKTLVDVIEAKEIGTFPPARQHNSEVPERVDLIVAKMTAKLPKYRYQSCAEVIRDLEALGLANPKLTFLEVAAGAAPAPHRSDEQPTPAPSSTRTPFPDQPGVPVDNAVWYVRYKRPNGRPVAQRLTTDQVLRLIESDEFDPGAKASHSPNEGFRALATFKEFTRALGKVARSHADKQTFRSRKLFDKIVEEHKERAKPEQAPVTNFQYWFGIGWRCAAVVGALAVLGFVISLVVSALK